MLSAAARISHSLDSLTRVDSTLQIKAGVLVADFKDHNSEPCEYPQGQPELCADYDMQRFMLNNRSADLQKEMKATAADRHALQGDFATLMTALQRARWDASVAGRRDQLLACSRLPAVHDAARCLRAGAGG